jgi:hypothetical protein
MRTFLVALLCFLGCLGGVFAKDEATREHDATIEWKVTPLEDLHGRPVSGLVATTSISYYFNREAVGMDDEGLAVIYDRLKSGKYNKVLFVCRSIDGTGATQDPIMQEQTWTAFNRIFRKMNIDVTVRYSRSEKDNVSFEDGNPFRPKKGTSRDGEGE